MNSLFNKTVRKVISLAQGNSLAQEQAGRITGEAANADMAQLARAAGAESCVLLKNDKHTLPIRRDAEIALFGRVQKNYFYVGNGSGGDVCAPYAVNLAQGLQNAGVRLNKDVLHRYVKWCSQKQNIPDPGFWGHWPRYYAEMPMPEALVKKAAETSACALVVLGRSAGEDRENVLKKGSFYLTRQEKHLLDTVTRHFSKVALLLNVGSIVDFSEIAAYGDRISAILLVWQLGMESGNAVADVLTGRINPCGKLPDTIAKHYRDYPSAANFGGKKENKYTEDIYVGYRYFETFAPQAVLYPFGFGLSYTAFELTWGDFAVEDQTVSATATVSNTGQYAGKEVVQLYVQCPCGRLGKPSKVLIAFNKTRLLAPGETQTLTLRAPLRAFASYDDTGITGHKSAWVLEQGAYQFYIGASVRDTSCDPVSWTLPADLVLEQLAECLAVPAHKCFNRLTAAQRNGKYVPVYLPVPAACTDLKQTILDNLPAAIPQTGDKGYKLSDVKNGSITLDTFIAQLNDQELETLCFGEGAMDSALGAKGNAGALGGVSASLRDKGVPPMITTDGPSGIRLQSTCSLLPSGTALASTWNLALVQKLYTEMGREMRAKGSDILLAPGMNIHRNPLCGRNFEYYSEDPLLSGQMAAATVQGIQKNKVSACPKHFACNNQESNRCYNDSVVSERALREIYLKGFEICIQTAKPKNIMTSYNKINGVWSHYNYALCTTVLRQEWGYTGNVITDWWMRYAPSPEFEKIRGDAYRVRAQVDVLMPGGKSSMCKERDDALLETLGQPEGITLGELQRTAGNVLRYILSTDKVR